MATQLFDPLQYRAQKAQEYQNVIPNASDVPPSDLNNAVSGKGTFASMIYKPFQEAGILSSGETKKNQPFIRKVGEDALTLGLVPAALVATVPDLVLHPIKSVERIATGFVQGVKDMFSSKQWSEHPLMNAVNTVSNISIVGGLVKSAAIGTARSAALGSARTMALEAGGDAAMVDVALKAASSPVKNALFTAVKDGSTESVGSVIKNSLMKGGLEETVAADIASKISTDVVGKFLTENSGKLKTVDAVTHPIDALGDAYRQISQPVQKLIFGTPEKSAVGKLYGSDVIAQNPKGYAMIEEWSGMQATEKGIKNTVENRTRIIQDWVKENPEYAALTPEERIAHFQNYAQSDLTRAQFATAQGREYILTKALPKDYVESMNQYVDSLPATMKNSEVIKELTDHYGNDFAYHVEEITKKMSGDLNGADRASLKTAIENLGNNQIPITAKKLTKAEQEFVGKLEGSGYRIGRAPKNKSISQPVNVTGEIYSKEDLIAARTTVGNLVDRLGISPHGVVEGTQNFAFREGFTQSLFKTFSGDKGIVVNGIRYPLRSIYFRLEKMREVLNSGVKVGTPVNTVADLRYGDLLKFGFDKADATLLDRVIRESQVTNPNIVGVGEALSNLVRAGNNPLSRVYNQFMKNVSEWRFRKNPMFGLQSAVETTVWGNLWAKKMPGSEFIGKYVNRISPFKQNVIKTFGEPTMAEQQAVLSEVLGDYNRQLLDSASPEIYRLTTEVQGAAKKGFAGVVEEMRFNKQNLDSNVWLGAANFSTVKLTTNLVKAYTERYGMTLDDALAFTMKGGKKVYNNPWLVEDLKSSVQGILGYKPGILTSPLIRTLNVVLFPIRFQTKTMIQTADWLGSLSPITRFAVMNQVTQTANWLTTDEGKKWAKGNRGMLASLFNYTFAFESAGKTIDAATKGKLFGGNAGLIGGLPFGFVANIARDLGVTSQEQQINEATGQPYQRTVVRKAASLAGFTTVVEDIVLAMFPSMPFNTATGGAINVSTSRLVRDIIEQSTAWGVGTVTGQPQKNVLKDLQRGEIKVAPEYRKKLPINILDIFKPNTASAAELPKTVDTFSKSDKAKISKNLLPSADAIKKQVEIRESLGNGGYTAVNKKSDDYGKYQINKATLAHWSKKWLGKDVTPEEFLKSPQMQEQFMDKEIEHLIALGVKKNDSFLVLHHRGFGDISSKRINGLKKQAEVIQYINKTS